MNSERSSRALARPQSTMQPGRAGVSRRTVARTAAWAVPVLTTAVAAPALAASGDGCQRRSRVPGTLSMTNGRASAVQFGTLTASMRFTQKRQGRVRNPFNDPLTGTTGTAQYPDTGWQYVVLNQDVNMWEGDYVTLTITFPTTVTGFSLTLTQIDADPGFYEDLVTLSPAGYGYTLGAQVSGAGSQTAPFESTRMADIHSPANDVTLTWPTTGAGASVFTVDLVAGVDGNNTCGQWIGVGDFSYESC